MSQLLDTQVLYDGRWVSREHFRTFVYNTTGEKLANSYQEFSDLISSGTWFADKNDIKPTNVVQMKTKRGRKCQNLNKA